MSSNNFKTFSSLVELFPIFASISASALEITPSRFLVRRKARKSFMEQVVMRFLSF